MRAKTIKSEKTAYTFDFDETLVTTDAKIHIYRNNKFIKSLTSSEFNFYKSLPEDRLDLSEFNDGDLILSAKKYKMWPLLKNLSQKIKTKQLSSRIFILTARHPNMRPYIYEFLKQNGIHIELRDVIAIGDDTGKSNLAEEKRKILQKISDRYKHVYFYDDNKNNVKLAQGIEGVTSKLVEQKIDK